MPARHLPRHGAAPVVTDEVEPFDTEGVGEAEHVADELLEAVLPHVSGAGARRVAPLVGSDGAIPGSSQRAELVPPRERRLRETVQQEHELAVGRSVRPRLEHEIADRQLHGRHGGERYPGTLLHAVKERARA